MFQNLPPQYQQYAQTYQQYRHLLPEAQRRQYEAYFQQLSNQNGGYSPNGGYSQNSAYGQNSGYNSYNHDGGYSSQSTGYAQPPIQPIVQQAVPRLIGYPSAPGVFTPATINAMPSTDYGRQGQYSTGRGYYPSGQNSQTSYNQGSYSSQSGQNRYQQGYYDLQNSRNSYNTPYSNHHTQVLTEEEYKNQRDRGSSDSHDQHDEHITHVPIQTSPQSFSYQPYQSGTPYSSQSGYVTGPNALATQSRQSNLQYPSQQYPYSYSGSNSRGYSNPNTYQSYQSHQPSYQYNKDCYPAYGQSSSNYYYPQRGSFGPAPQVVGPTQGYSSQPYVQDPRLQNTTPRFGVFVNSGGPEDSTILSRPNNKNMGNEDDDFDHLKKIRIGESSTETLVNTTTTTKSPPKKNNGTTTTTTTSKPKTGSTTSIGSTTSSAIKSTTNKEEGAAENKEQDDELVEATSTADIPLSSSELKKGQWNPADLNAESDKHFPVPKNLRDLRQDTRISEFKPESSTDPQLVNTISLIVMQALQSLLSNGYGSPYSMPFQPAAGFGLNIGPQWGYEVNAGVYAGVNGNQGSYGAIPNGVISSVPNNQIPRNQGSSPLSQRPYGPTNTNVGGSYGGLSPWPFLPPSAVNSQSQNSTNPTMRNDHKGSVKPVSIKSLVNKPEEIVKDDEEVLISKPDEHYLQ
ncbi:unnamed protein product [Bursaphelenchus okinawaensis]|uniref:Uncharacterized protein n=1 Tax=Bursaphelenchus okinawaensis TaxID=465554 RepID=A0A811KUL5_9BILA|nr:unnamed protein product [Bursaphelenchus okinawaensis]CAG9113514.1 unnamed protein product [Bursaphelenchus okinawaensis]